MLYNGRTGIERTIKFQSSLMKTGYAFQLPHVAATNLLHDIGQFKIPDRERKLIQDFTMYLNRGAIVEANDFPSMENLRSVMDSVNSVSAIENVSRNSYWL